MDLDDRLAVPRSLTLASAVTVAVLAASQRSDAAQAVDGLRGEDFPQALVEVGDVPNYRAIDLDGDGHVDAVGTEQLFGSTQIVVRPGSGDGTFGSPVVTGTAFSASSILFADVDGDGTIDVAATTVGSGTGGISVLRGLGALTFDVAGTSLTLPNIRRLLAGDLDGDGAAELVAVRGGTIEIYSFTAGGRIVLDREVSTFTASTEAALADVDGDGFLDVYVGGDGPRLYVWYGGPPSVAELREYPVIAATSFGEVARDVDGDGDVDFVSRSSSFLQGVNGVRIIENLGGRDLAAPRYESVAGGTPDQVDVADLNGDGHPDLIYTQRGTPEAYLEVALGTATGLVGPVVQRLRPAEALVRFERADFDGDLVDDLLLTSEEDETLGVVFGEGDGTFEAAHVNAHMLRVTDMVAGSFLGGTGSSIAVLERDPGNLVVFRDPSDLQAPPAVNVPIAMNPFEFFAADLDLDGDDDLVLIGGEGGTRGFTVVRNESPGTMAPLPMQVVPDGPAPIPVTRGAIADVNGDGLPDVIVGFGGGGTSAWLGAGDGTFVQQPGIGSPGTELQTLDVGDVNGDGFVDVVGTTTNAQPGRLVVALGMGDGTFGDFAVVASGSQFRSRGALGDLDGDGHLDYAVSNFIPQQSRWTLAVFYGAGDGTFPERTDTTVERNLVDLVLEDIDLDGRDDAVLTYSVSLFFMTVLQGRADRSFEAPVQYRGGGSRGAIAPLDLEGDGNVDLAVIGRQFGQYWLYGNRAEVRLAAYCPATENSSGAAATARAAGSRSVSAGDLLLCADSMPADRPYVWFAGFSRTFRPLGPTRLCVQAPLMRLTMPLSTGGSGAAELALPLGTLGVSPGETAYFQAWFREAPGEPFPFNFTNGVAVRATQ